MIDRFTFLLNRRAMRFWQAIDLFCVRRYERAFLRASRAERRMRG